jgi:hypothetical protein
VKCVVELVRLEALGQLLCCQLQLLQVQDQLVQQQHRNTGTVSRDVGTFKGEVRVVNLAVVVRGAEMCVTPLALAAVASLRLMFLCAWKRAVTQPVTLQSLTSPLS